MAKTKRARPSQITWFHRYLKNSINQIFAWSPYRRESRKLAIIRKSVVNGEVIEVFRCHICQKETGRKDMHCDHLVPREALTEWDGWGPYIDRALEHDGVAGLQWICTTCHKAKTKTENDRRRKARKK